MSCKYLYGISRSASCPNIVMHPVGAERNAAPEPMSWIKACGLAMLVSDIASPDVRRSRRNLLAHTKILERAMSSGPMLPMQFGLIATSEDEVLGVLDSRQSEIERQLDHIAGRHEVGIQAFWSEDRCLRDIANQCADIAAVYRTSQSGGYDAKLSLGRHVAERLADWRRTEERALFNRLSSKAFRAVRQTTSADMMVLRASFLVNPEEDAKLMSELAAWRDGSARGARFACIGPAPPFHFVSLRLDWPAPSRAA